MTAPDRKLDITQAELRAVLKAQLALNRLSLGLCRKIAAGARVKHGRYYIGQTCARNNLDLNWIKRRSTWQKGRVEWLDIGDVDQHVSLIRRPATAPTRAGKRA